MRGAWIEIIATTLYQKHGLSLPVRGAWIEIIATTLYQKHGLSLPVRGAWIEMRSAESLSDGSGRSPCGERGLK